MPVLCRPECLLVESTDTLGVGDDGSGHVDRHPGRQEIARFSKKLSTFDNFLLLSVKMSKTKQWRTWKKVVGNFLIRFRIVVNSRMIYVKN